MHLWHDCSLRLCHFLVLLSLMSLAVLLDLYLNFTETSLSVLILMVQWLTVLFLDPRTGCESTPRTLQFVKHLKHFAKQISLADVKMRS